MEVLSCRISSIKVIADKYFENINSFELRRIEKKITKRTSTDYSSARKQGSSKTSLRDECNACPISSDIVRNCFEEEIKTIWKNPFKRQ